MFTIAICDDEQFFLNSIRKKVGQYFTMHNLSHRISEFQDGESLLLSQQVYDIILMDLKLPGKNGMDVIGQLRKNKKESQVIFITAYQEYALQAFHVDAAHYLLKPVTDENLYEALGRSVERIRKYDTKTLSITKGKRTDIILLKDILYCEAMDHRIYIHTSAASYDYLGTLDELHKHLDSRFFRCHKSFIVNITQVVSSQGDTATVTGGGQVLISRRKQRDFTQELLSSLRRELLS